MSEPTTLVRLATLLAGSGETSPASSVRQAMKLHVVDSIGAWIAGAGAPDGRRLIVVRRRSPPLQRDDVALHCAVARSSEVDDINLAAMITPGSIVVPAALAVAQAWGIAPMRLAGAINAGYEAMVRFGLAIDGPSVLYRGIWPTYLACPFGVAAVASNLIGLNGERTAHALALALTLAAPGVGRQSETTNTRWFAMANGVRNGLFSARMAEADFTSDVGLFDGDFFQSIYTIKPDLAALTAGFGDHSAILGTSFKPWCAARQTMAATHAFKEVLRGVNAAEIDAVEVFVPPPHRRMVDHGVVATDRLSHLTSLHYQIAVAAYAPAAAFDVGKEQPVFSLEVQALMEKVKVHPDESLMAGYPRTWPARVVVTAGSRRHERRATHVPGDPELPLDENAVAEKFRRLVAPVLGPAPAEEMLALSLSVLDEGAAQLMPRIQQLYDSILPGQR